MKTLLFAINQLNQINPLSRSFSHDTATAMTVGEFTVTVTVL